MQIDYASKHIDVLRNNRVATFAAADNMNWLSFDHIVASQKYAKKVDVASSDAIENQGQVKRMSIPKGWHENAPLAGATPDSSVRSLHPSGSNAATMNFYYRGIPLNENTAASFSETLAKPPHALSSTEWKAIAPLLGDKCQADAFRTLSARTQDINNKRVLVVEGRYSESQQDTYHVYVDAGGAGKVVQEIFYKAPKEEYPRYFREATGAIKSIDWR